MSEEVTDDEREIALLDAIEDPELRKIVEKGAEVREMVAGAMSYAVDSTAMKSARQMMSSPDVPDGVKKDLILGWMEHRRKDKELRGKLASGNTGEGVTFNVSFATNAEVDNMKRARKAFGVDDAEVTRDE